MMNHRIFTGLLISVFVFFNVNGQENNSYLSVTGSFQWSTFTLQSRTELDLSKIQITLPTGRSIGEQLISMNFPDKIHPVLFSLQVDSTTTLGKIIDEGQVTLTEVDKIINQSPKSIAFIDFQKNTLVTSYSIDLKNIAALLVRHQKPISVSPPIIPIPARDYSGIIIIADSPLPWHGKRTTATLTPALFPRVWDTSMNLIYEKNNVEPAIIKTNGMIQYASRSAILESSPSGISRELQERVGTTPLRILARGVFGVQPTDPIIDSEDALLILSSEHNRQLLTHGRVVIIINQNLLEQTF